MFKFSDAVSKSTVISPISLNLIQKKYQVNLLQCWIKFYPNQLKSVQENETKRFSFALTLLHPDKVKVSESDIKWLKVLISMAGMKTIC